jgi:hypothetical protein
MNPTCGSKSITPTQLASWVAAQRLMAEGGYEAVQEMVGARYERDPGCLENSLFRFIYFKTGP